MNRLVLACCSLALTASTALAGGVNLGWNQCWPEGGTANKKFACASNSGSDVLVGSFQPASPHSKFVGIEVILDGQSVLSALPDWWQLWNAGACRQAALTASADFLTAPMVACADPWLGLAQGGIAAYQTTLFPPPPPINIPSANVLRIKVAYALVEPETLVAGTEYYGFKLTISHVNSTGPGACAGCDAGLCLVLTQIKAVDTNGFIEYLTTPIQNQSVSWECATLQEYILPPPVCLPVSGCTVAARSRTWGQVKAMDR